MDKRLFQDASDTIVWAVNPDEGIQIGLKAFAAAAKIIFSVPDQHAPLIFIAFRVGVFAPVDDPVVAGPVVVLHIGLEEHVREDIFHVYTPFQNTDVARIGEIGAADPILIFQLGPIPPLYRPFNVVPSTLGIYPNVFFDNVPIGVFVGIRS